MDCIKNLADAPEHRDARDKLSARLTAVLTELKDPLALGTGDVFDSYLAVPSGGHNMFFQAQAGSWFSTFFGNDSHAPFKERPGIVPVVFDETGKVAPK
jgi:hypothetical protein